MDGTEFEHVTCGKVGEGHALDKHIFTNITWLHRVPFSTQRLKHLQAPNAQRSCWTAVMLEVALAVTNTTCGRHAEDAYGRLWNATLGSRMKRDNARFCHHGNHSA